VKLGARASSLGLVPEDRGRPGISAGGFLFVTPGPRTYRKFMSHCELLYVETHAGDVAEMPSLLPGFSWRGLPQDVLHSWRALRRGDLRMSPLRNAGGLHSRGAPHRRFARRWGDARLRAFAPGSIPSPVVWLSLAFSVGLRDLGPGSTPALLLPDRSRRREPANPPCTGLYPRFSGPGPCPGWAPMEI
jgi:hypothetical protein